MRKQLAPQHKKVGDRGPDEHLRESYAIAVGGLAQLDRDVVRVDMRDGPSWVARVFPASRDPAGAEGDAAILRALEQAGFPAERCAAAEPVRGWASAACS